MATKTATKTTKATAKKAAAQTNEKFNVVDAARKGALAYVGLYGYAYDRAKFRFEQARELATTSSTSTTGFFGDLVEKGQGVEVEATKLFKNAQAQALKTYGERTVKVKAALPKFANDRVSELEAEVIALNKKITALSKKTRTVKKPVPTKMKTEKAAPKVAPTPTVAPTSAVA